ncbi:hypothetical protein LCGC14_0195970 [marine sediment metagenome]|uniref:Uncharacterized protein n=1 Tax=marine sediment metagenome TaxID=412755 RepID=A0A0F9UQ52_9ZZZZ
MAEKLQYLEFYKELADLLDKYRPIKDQIDYRREDEDWMQLRLPYSFMLGDKDYSYELYLYKCSNSDCGSQDFTNEPQDNIICEFCNKGTMEKVELTHHNDWLKYSK